MVQQLLMTSYVECVLMCLMADGSTELKLLSVQTAAGGHKAITEWQSHFLKRDRMAASFTRFCILVRYFVVCFWPELVLVTFVCLAWLRCLNCHSQCCMNTQSTGISDNTHHNK